MKNMINKNKGITLIALVITIIVLLILAGITIATLTGENGLLHRATQAKDATKKAELIEKVKLEILNKKIANNDGTLTKDDLRDILSEYFEDIDSIELPDDLSNSTIKLNANEKYGGFNNIDISDIYSGKLTEQQAGLYDTTTGILKKSWEELIEEGTIIVNNGAVSTGWDTSLGNTNPKSDKLDGKLVIDDSISSLFYSAFKSCEKISEIKIPSSVTTIMNSSFEGCKKLKEITIPDSVEGILNNGIFYDCNQLEKVIIGAGITKIESTAFNSNCTSLKEVVIGNGVTEILSGSFRGCSSLENVIFGSNVTSIDWTFEGCPLKELVIPDNITSMAGAFRNCSEFTSIKIGNGITLIDYLGCGCNKLTSVEIGDGVEEITGQSFIGCTSLTNVKFGNSVKKITNMSFLGCTSLESITIPDSIEEISSNAFNNCPNLKEIHYNGTDEQWEQVTANASYLTSLKK